MTHIDIIDHLQDAADHEREPDLIGWGWRLSDADYLGGEPDVPQYEFATEGDAVVAAMLWLHERPMLSVRYDAATKRVTWESSDSDDAGDYAYDRRKDDDLCCT